MTENKNEKMERTTILINSDLWKRFRIQAIRENKSAYQLLSEVVESYLKSREGQR
jgi:hypothetical protein